MPGSGLDLDLLTLAAERLQESKKAPTSKYDYVKIKVWLGENQEHYYILSRFLISRMLTVTRVPQDKVSSRCSHCTPFPSLRRPSHTSQRLCLHPTRLSRSLWR